MISIMTTGIMTAFCFSYTFRERGFETEGGQPRAFRRHRLFSCIPEKQVPSACGRTGKLVGISVCAFSGPGSRSFFRKIRDSFGPVVTVPADSFPIQLWLNLHRGYDKMAGSCGGMRGGDPVYRFQSSLLRTLEETAAACADALWKKASAT